MTTALGAAAATWAVMMALSPLLQIRAIVRRRSSRGVSVAYFGILLVGFALWVGYGTAIGNLVVVVPNAVAFVVCGVTIAVALRYR